MNNLKEDWDWITLFENSNLNFDVLAESKENLSQYIKLSITIEEDEEGNEFDYISYTENLTSKFVKKYKNIFLNNRGVFYEIHEKGILTLEDIEQDPSLIVEYKYLSRNPNLTIDYVIENKDKPWSIIALSSNKGFKMKDIYKGTENGIKWNFMALSSNPNITFDYIYSNRNEDRNNHQLSQNLFIEQRKISIKEFGLKEILLNDINNIVLDY